MKKERIDIINSVKKYEMSAKKVIAVIKKVYPIGDVVNVMLGGHMITVEITRHSTFWWSDPEYMTGRNVKTLKNRRFHWSNIVSKQEPRP